MQVRLCRLTHLFLHSLLIHWGRLLTYGIAMDGLVLSGSMRQLIIRYAGKSYSVREWMAHHLGMSLLATLNLLHDNVVQRWFHANPLIQATELVLHEKPVSVAVLEARLKE